MDYRNPAACIDLIRRLRVEKVDEAHERLVHIVDGQLEGAPPPARHLEVLELARAPIAAVQHELGRRYAAHPLPPDSVENATLRRVVDLWRALARSYAEIGLRDTAGALVDRMPLLAQRRLQYSGRILLEYFRAHRALPPGLWLQVHEDYARAEAQGIAQIRVSDPQNEVWKAQSTSEAYMAMLLVELANPFGRSEQEFNWVCRWAQRFAPYCTLDEGSDGLKPTVYGLDLGMDHGLRPRGLLSSSPKLRHFDSSRLAGQIKAMITQFKQGVTPASLGLGSDCPLDACARLLLSLYRPWGLASAGRRFPRRGCQGGAQVCSDWLAIGFHIEGKVFSQPRPLALPHSLYNDIATMTFGERVPEAVRADAAERLGLGCVRWEVADQSVTGFRLQQRPQTERLEHHQLVGILPPDGERFLLGRVSWLMYRTDGVLEAGIHVLPGLPKVIAARQLGLHADVRAPYHQAFLLPATPALKTAPTLVLPGGWFQPSRVVELYDGRATQVRLGQLVLAGTNFDQVSFEPIGPAV